MLGLIEGLKKKDANLEFSVISRYKEDEYWNKLGISSYQPLLVYKEHFSFLGKIGGLLSFLIFLGKHYLLILRAYIYKVFGFNLFYGKEIRAFLEADFIISKGGSFFREPDYSKNILPFGILVHLNQIAIPIVLGKKVVLSAQSFGPISNPFSKFLLKRYFNRVSLITVRESDSAEFLRKMGVHSPIKVVGDSAFILCPSGATNESDNLREVIKRISSFKSEKKILVGCTIRNWSRTKEFENYLNVLGNFFKKLNGENMKIIFMPQVVGPSKYENDTILSKFFVDRFGLDAYVVDGDYPIPELIELYGKMDYFVATRLHSSIYAIRAEVPVVVIAYEPKTLGIFKDLKLDDFVLDIRHINPENLESAFKKLDVYRNKFIMAGKNAHEMAEKNIDLIYGLIS